MTAKALITHPYVSAQPDSGNPDEVSSDEWNAAHSLAGVIIENDQIIDENYTIPANKNAISAGPIEIADGVDVVVEGDWVIV